MWSSRRVVRATFAAAVLVGAGLGAAAAAGAFSPSTRTPAQRAAAARRRLLAAETRTVDLAASAVNARLPIREGAPAPAVPEQLYRAPLPRHAVYGFVPYWELDSLTPADYDDTSVLSYYGLTVGATGGLDHSGNGWDDLSSPSFAAFVESAHAANDRVLLTVSTETPAVITHLTSYPAPTSGRLAAQLATIVSSDHLDGVDIDIEGRATADRAGFVTFVTDLSRALRASDPGGQLVLDTYPQSAGSSSDFFDVALLAPQVDTLFVMAYDMNDPTISSASSPLASPSLGLSDVGSIRAYVKVVAPAKLVLGLPLYGNEFTTSGRAPGSPTLSEDPVELTYAQVLAAGRHASWDPASLTPYTVFRQGKQWHQTWYDDPVSLALKTALAARYHLAGVGAWALGQEGTATDVLEALDGGSAPEKLSATG
jgi:hypothetical protein